MAKPEVSRSEDVIRRRANDTIIFAVAAERARTRAHTASTHFEMHRVQSPRRARASLALVVLFSMSMMVCVDIWLSTVATSIRVVINAP